MDIIITKNIQNNKNSNSSSIDNAPRKFKNSKISSSAVHRSLSLSKNAHIFNFLFYVVVFLTLNNVFIKPLEAINKIGCLIAKDVCEADEFCLDDTFLGICLNKNEDYENSIRESLRSEQEIPLYLNSPIRIHKYNIRDDDSEKLQNVIDFFGNLNDDQDNADNINENQESSLDDANSNNDPIDNQNKPTGLYISNINKKNDYDDDNDDDDEEKNIINPESEIQQLIDNYDEQQLNDKLASLLETKPYETQNSYDQDDIEEDDTHDDDDYEPGVLDTYAQSISKRSLPLDLFSADGDYQQQSNILDDFSDQYLANVNDDDEEEDDYDDDYDEDENYDQYVNFNSNAQMNLKNKLEHENRLIDKLIAILSNQNENENEYVDYRINGNNADYDLVDDSEKLSKRFDTFPTSRNFYYQTNNYDFNDDQAVDEANFEDVDTLPQFKPNRFFQNTRLKFQKLLFNTIQNGTKNGNQIKFNGVDDASSLNADDNQKLISPLAKLRKYFSSSIYVYLIPSRNLNDAEKEDLINFILTKSSIPANSIKNINVKSNNAIWFQIKNQNADSPSWENSNYEKMLDLSKQIVNNQFEYLNKKGIKIYKYGIGQDIEEDELLQTNKQQQQHHFNFRHPFDINSNSEKFFLFTLVICGSLTILITILFIIFILRRKAYLSGASMKDAGSVYRINFDDNESLITNRKDGKQSRINRACRWLVERIKCTLSCRTTNTGLVEAGASQLVTSQDYQDLCRQRMHSKSNITVVAAGSSASIQNETNRGNVSPTLSIDKSSFNQAGFETKGSGQNSPRSSTSSWNEEPIKSFNIDITTGHIILSYMEEHLNDKHRLQEEWNSLCTYEPDPNSTEVGNLPENVTKNRYSNIVPFDHSRVKLKNGDNDYINANYIIDDDPRNPSYIAAQGPLMHTTNDFWNMVWQEESVVIVSLCRTIEYGSAKCHQFWPANGFCVYDKFEIHLVSEHVWCEDFLVRNFFLKNLELNQTRTVTQFHYLTWPENGIPQNIKSFLDFRRKVNKSFKAKSSPLIVHCNDGVARTGTYILIDMVLNKIAKGAKEINLSATLEYLRDQRPGMIKNKTQFDFSFAVITEELHNMLKALRQ